jgi:hypothetical protein
VGKNWKDKNWDKVDKKKRQKQSTKKIKANDKGFLEETFVLSEKGFVSSLEVEEHFEARVVEVHKRYAFISH